ncbi:hypothetical protein [Paenibacillus sp. LHD-38]|uniref:family 4 glycosyl hydrolase n=1 Tax=Paenibacillus sp. LHD-38 TaxID=3072143 RepID=UPI00280D12DB|nr:hypothetical protein [Paenibacillus sp. LHD-38]MDQ8737047.1 hypothetical protein [Paenibacillus sp. LHD-38]
MKIVLIGGGSFVFAPTVLEDIIVKQRLTGCELVLVDPNLEAAEAMAAAARHIAGELKVAMRTSATSNRREALAGAQFVIISASVQGAHRWQIDYDILSALGMADQARECGGMGGLMNGFRSITLLMDICRDMEELCPEAWILDVTNPMPRVVTAVARYSTIRIAGFCNIAYRGAEGYTFLPKLLGRKAADVSIVSAGLNHFAWLLQITDNATGEDLLPGLRAYIEEGSWAEQDEETRRELRIMKRWLEEYGAIAAGHADHHAEYLPPQRDIHYTTSPPYHGSAEERSRRMEELRQIGAGGVNWNSLFEHGSWEHPVLLELALHSGGELSLDILNVKNEGAIPGLPADRIVEVPVKVSNRTILPLAVPALPDKLLELCRAVSDVHELVAEAAVTGSREIAKLAIDADPAIVNKAVAYTALEQMLEAHADLLPQFNGSKQCF